MGRSRRLFPCSQTARPPQRPADVCFPWISLEVFLHILREGGIMARAWGAYVWAWVWGWTGPGELRVRRNGRRMCVSRGYPWRYSHISYVREE